MPLLLIATWKLDVRSVPILLGACQEAPSLALAGITKKDLRGWAIGVHAISPSC